MSNDNVAHAISGAGGGALASIVTYPLITLSTRAQTEAVQAKKHKGAESENANVSAIDAARAIIKREGISGLYAGLDSSIYGMTVTNFIYYYFYEGMKAIYLEKSPVLTTGQAMLSGTVAGAATTVLTNPIWVVNTRQMVGDTEKASTVQVIRRIYEQDGLPAFFSGVGPALALVINPVLNYTIFEALRKSVEKTRKMTSLDAFALGAIGKIVATSLTYPIITLKSRLQLRKREGEERNGLLSTVRQSIANEGVKGLYKGWSTKVLQSALQSAFLFFFKEQLFSVAILLLAFLRKLRASA